MKYYKIKTDFPHLTPTCTGEEFNDTCRSFIDFFDDQFWYRDKRFRTKKYPHDQHPVFGDITYRSRGRFDIIESHFGLGGFYISERMLTIFREKLNLPPHQVFPVKCLFRKTEYPAYYLVFTRDLVLDIDYKLSKFNRYTKEFSKETNSFKTIILEENFPVNTLDEYFDWKSKCNGAVLGYYIGFSELIFKKHIYDYDFYYFNILENSEKIISEKARNVLIEETTKGVRVLESDIPIVLHPDLK